MILRSLRLTLYPLTREDHRYFHDLNVNPFVRKFLWGDQVISVDKTEEILQKNEDYFKERSFGLWKLESKINNRIIGYAGLWYFFDEHQPQLLYVVDQRFTRFGYATEASRCIINYAFEELSFSYLVATTDASHLVSQKVAMQAGMRFSEERMIEGRLTRFYKIEKHLPKATEG